MVSSINIGICGLGTVGGGVFELLHTNNELICERTNCAAKVVQVASRSLPQGFNLGQAEFTSDIFAIANNPQITVLIELIGGINPALELVLTAIENGKHVITANKALLAQHGSQIFAAAQKKGVIVAFEAAVAGAIPIIKILRESLAADKIEWLAGIINGTSNFILSEMQHKGRHFGQALLDAQKLGYAEVDPTFDVAGIDAAHKLTLLASLAFGMPLKFADVYCEGITELSSYDVAHAASLGYNIKHLGIAKRTQNGVELRVHPTLIAQNTLLAKVDDVKNAVLVKSAAAGMSLYYGAGAGAKPTANAVIADVIDLMRGNCSPFLGQDKLQDLPALNIEHCVSAYYLRLMVQDEPGVLAQITQVFSDLKINIETIVQKESEERDGIIPLIIVTHQEQELLINQAIIQLEQNPCVIKKVVKIRMLEN